MAAKSLIIVLNMTCKVLIRKFFFEPEVLSASTTLYFNKSPITCYNTIADMSKYPEFVPWMQAVKLDTTGPTTKDCVIKIGYPPFNQSYLSKVTLDFPKKIVSLSNNNDVFEVMESIWEFSPDPTEIIKDSNLVPLTRCQSIYTVKFKFNSPLYQNFSSIVLNLILNETSKAFVKRVATFNNIKCSYDKTLNKVVQSEVDIR